MILTLYKKNQIYTKTRGRCHLCGRPHAFNKHGKSWHVEHSRSRKNGGTNHLNNLFVGCVQCNLEKGGEVSSRAFRSSIGLARIPYSQSRIDRRNDRNALIGALIGGLGVGLMTKTWKGAFGGAALGAVVGYCAMGDE